MVHLNNWSKAALTLVVVIDDQLGIDFRKNFPAAENSDRSRNTGEKMDGITLAAFPHDGAQCGLVSILEAGQIVPLAQVRRIRLHVRQR